MHTGLDSSPAVETVRPERALASWWHTALVVALLVGVSLLGAFTRVRAPVAAEPGAKVVTYVTSIGFQWFLLFVAWLGFRKRVRLRELIGGRWRQVEDALLDVAVAVLFWFAALAVLGGMAYAFGLLRPEAAADFRQKVAFVAPTTNLQLALFLVLSLSAGICEEIVFRGYLQRQFGAWFGNAWVGIALQALVFGLGHGYQGAPRMVMIGVFGAMFGVLAHRRRSLRPAMMAHTLHDAAAGLVLRFAKV